MRLHRYNIVLVQVALAAVILAIWEWGWQLNASVSWLVPDVLDPYFVSRPTEIFARFLRLGCLDAGKGDWTAWASGEFGKCLARSENNIWVATAVTLKNTFFGFLLGVSTGFLGGLVLGRSELLSEIFNPFIVAANSVPRIALAPIIVLACGIGDSSKVVTAWIIVIFLVFFNTFEGARAVNPDHISASRLLGASEWQVTRTVIIPSAMAWLFASLTPAISFALIGVIVGEFIGADRGIGRLIIESEARGEAAGMMVAVFVLMIVGVVLSAVVHRVQAHLLRWQPQYQQGT